ncbi:hypothetical protein MSG28_000144 [Choristoneura fumiferana]|uniref:Uncharacterized protein n=1 Tax=Choristoneura fumiferana TaxID=7141 RepID=A0ACC0JZF1_CHOFU|nr:hypothetical protein MSG28_000144 [Choristoneura fumiferana]
MFAANDFVRDSSGYSRLSTSLCTLTTGGGLPQHVRTRRPVRVDGGEGGLLRGLLHRAHSSRPAAPITSATSGAPGPVLTVYPFGDLVDLVEAVGMAPYAVCGSVFATVGLRLNSTLVSRNLYCGT